MASTLVAPGNIRTAHWGMAIVAGIIAMIVFTIVEMAFSWAIRGTWPWTPLETFGAIVRNVITPGMPATAGVGTAAAGSALLLVLGVLSGVIVAAIVHRLGMLTAAIVGVAFGLAMYAIDMYGFARVFPSLAGLRDWMSVLAYVIQGALTAGLYKVLTPPDADLAREDTGHDLRRLRDVRLV
jgi:hypothetical protein